MILGLCITMPFFTKWYTVYSVFNASQHRYDTHSSKSTHERQSCVSLLKSFTLLHTCMNLHVACMFTCKLFYIRNFLKFLVPSQQLNLLHFYDTLIIRHLHLPLKVENALSFSILLSIIKEFFSAILFKYHQML